MSDRISLNLGRLLIALVDFRRFLGLAVALIGSALCVWMDGTMKLGGIEVAVVASFSASGVLGGFIFGTRRGQEQRIMQHLSAGAPIDLAKSRGPDFSFENGELLLPSRTKWLSLAAVTPPLALFVAWYASALRARDEAMPLHVVLIGTRALSYFVAALFVQGYFVSLAHLVPGSSFLRIAPAGMTVRWLWRTCLYRWADIESFGVHHLGRVAFNFSPTGVERVKRRAHRLLVGYEGELPDNFGMPPSALAAYLTIARERYLNPARLQ